MSQKRNENVYFQAKKLYNQYNLEKKIQTIGTFWPP